ncbi:glycosyltransferase family 4 protein [Candidatus Haliotispira prima]|uniref:Glycosyltransferase family 4 protein n=1 Tax=Candidatus Haliotispira prima TaxID=3034016 RepID=A0ABY8MJ84_9SPIO|nr:glycosyltransferase family 4 protein [Candidatus Haliotispira prima]
MQEYLNYPKINKSVPGTGVDGRKKLLLLHCEYLQKAGEDRVVEEESALLEQHYHLLRFIRSNEELLEMNRLTQLKKMIWNQALCNELQQFLQQHEPDIIHVHNTFPLFSPAIFRVLGRWKKRLWKQGKQVKIVMTLHNFRLHCPQASLMRPLRRKGKVIGRKLCQRCFAKGGLSKFPGLGFVSALRSRCYRDSLSMTWAMVGMLSLHRRLRSWHDNVDIYIYLNSAQKTLLSRVGLPEEKFVYKPNFLAETIETQAEEEVYTAETPELNNSFRLLFAGRLSEEKGIRILLSCMTKLRKEYGISRNIELHIAGDGPLRPELESFIEDYESAGWPTSGSSANAAGSSSLRMTREGHPQISIRYLGKLDKDALQNEMKWAHFLLLPSIWYEGMPMILLESLAQGRPVLGFRLGANAEVLHHQENGILAPFFLDAQAERGLHLSRTYSPDGLVQNLTAAITEANVINQERYCQMCRAARKSFETHYTARKNLGILQTIYEDPV